jgi:hypothetical protein
VLGKSYVIWGPQASWFTGSYVTQYHSINFKTYSTPNDSEFVEIWKEAGMTYMEKQPCNLAQTVIFSDLYSRGAWFESWLGHWVL